MNVFPEPLAAWIDDRGLFLTSNVSSRRMSGDDGGLAGEFDVERVDLNAGDVMVGVGGSGGDDLLDGHVMAAPNGEEL